MSIGTPGTCEKLLVRAPFQFRRERGPLPDPGASGYLVRVDVCGLCRSDLHAAASWAGDWQEVGHEFGGTVLAAPAAARFAPGDRVAVRNASPCGQCPSCQAGVARACARLVVNMQGFRDVAVCDARSLVDASGLDDDALALVEPTNVALDLLHAAGLERTHRVTVVGAGTLGLLTAYLARHVWGVPQVTLVGRRPCSPLAASLGLTDYVQAVPCGDLSPGRRAAHTADRVLVTTPPSTLEDALAFCRPGGWVLTVGLDDTERCRITLDIGRLIFGQHTLKGVCAAPNAHFEQAIEVLRLHGPHLRAIIGRRVPRAALESALQDWHTRVQYEGKTIVVGDGRIQ